MEAIKFLVQAKAKTYYEEMNQRDRSPIFIVVHENNLKCVSLFLDMKVDFDKPTSSGINAIHLAEQLGHHEILSLLWIKCEQLRNTEDTNGHTILSKYILLREELNFTKALLVKGGDINYRNSKEGNTVLHQAILMKNKHAIQFILDNNANPHLENEQEYDCCDLAQQFDFER